MGEGRCPFCFFFFFYTEMRVCLRAPRRRREGANRIFSIGRVNDKLEHHKESTKKQLDK